MDLHIKDKVVIVTGGAKGISCAISRACADEGAIPAILDRDSGGFDRNRGPADRKKSTLPLLFRRVEQGVPAVALDGSCR